MNKTVALSLSLLVMMGAISGCSSSSPIVDSSPTVSANTSIPTIPPKALDETTESLRVKGEVLLNRLAKDMLSEETRAFHEESKMYKHPENGFIALEAHYADNPSYMEEVEKDIALSDEFSPEISSMAKYSNTSEKTIYKSLLMKELHQLIPFVNLDKVKWTSPREVLGIFPGTMKNKTGEFVLSPENTYVKNMDGVIMRSLNGGKAVLTDDGNQIVFHPKADNKENKSALSYDAALYDHFKKTTAKIRNKTTAVKELNATPFSPGTTYTLVKKEGNGYIPVTDYESRLYGIGYVKVTDSQSILAGNGDLLFKLAFVE